MLSSTGAAFVLGSTGLDLRGASRDLETEESSALTHLLQRTSLLSLRMLHAHLGAGLSGRCLGCGRQN